MMAAAGYRNLQNSQAYQNITLANKQAMENHVTHVQTYFEGRKLNRQYTQAEQMPLLTSEQLFRIAKEAAPQPLRDSQLDPVTGQVEWPIVLQEDAYTAQREELNKLMAARSSRGGVSPQEYRQIQQTTSQMLATLKSNLRDYKPDDYIQAKNFIESLSYQVQRTAS